MARGGAKAPAPRTPGVPPASPFTATGEGVRIAVRLTPRAARDSVDGLAAARDGAPALAVRVRAVPEKGRANEALIAVLAAALDVPAGRLVLVSGPKDRHKAVLARGEPAALLRRLEDWLTSLSP